MIRLAVARRHFACLHLANIIGAHVGASEAKTNLSKLVDRAAAGDSPVGSWRACLLSGKASVNKRRRER